MVPGQIQPPSGARLTAVSASFSGPLPPPATLERYAHLIPNGAERIMAMAESQAAHRQELESLTVKGNLRAQRLGQFLAFFLFLAALAASIYFVSAGQPIAGISALFVELFSGVAVFIYGRRGQEKERAEKVDQLDRAAKG